MARISRCVVLFCGFALSAGVAAAQEQTIVSLPWTSGFSAGPLARNYNPPDDARDIWVVEDFEIDRPWVVGRFKSTGSGIGGATDVTAVILDGYPGPQGGQEVMRSTVGVGRYINQFPWGYYQTNFGNQRLAPGRYTIMWNVSGTNITPVMFVQGGNYTVGVGEPNNAYQYNPGGAWNQPEGVLDPVTDDLNNQGNPIGVNFTLFGVPAPICPADFNWDGFADFFDFTAFVDCFEGVNCPFARTADFNGDGFADFMDFTDYVDAFEAGC